LGKPLAEFLRRRVYPRQRKLGRVGAAWGEMLPEGLREHTCLEGLARGTLRVLVDDAASLYELRLATEDLLEQLRQACPSAGVSEIHFVRGCW